MPIKQLLAKIKTWFKRPITKPEGGAVSTLKPIIKKQPLFKLLIVLLLLGLVLAFGAVMKGKQETEETPSSVTATPTPEEAIASRPSNYATDSAVLKIEAEIAKLKTNLKETDLAEAGLNPPLLDWEVEFEANGS